ncbi:lamin tail domain-containing protein [Cohnella hongkongensis]|uniref:Lamin tail domain-containing protein n=1 Tax=Cohnella hongkongensis TaxID=178337 RepID=A0ABV9F8P8_9BACL
MVANWKSALARAWKLLLASSLWLPALSWTGEMRAAEASTVQSAAMELIITEAYIDDIDRSHWVPAGVSNFDVMEFVEIYNPTDNPVNFSANYDLYHFRNSANREYSLPLYQSTGDVIVPAHGSVVLWGFLATRYSKATSGETPTIEDFRSVFQLDDSVPVYMINTTSSLGFYNTYNGSFRIKDKSGNLVAEAAFTPATDSADGQCIEFRMPPEGVSMLPYKAKADPSPGAVAAEQHTPPPIPNTPVFGSLSAKEELAAGEPFTLSADIVDATRAFLFLKQSDATNYRKIPMSHQGGTTFGATVPRAQLWGGDAELVHRSPQRHQVGAVCGSDRPGRLCLRPGEAAPGADDRAENRGHRLQLLGVLQQFRQDDQFCF